MFLGIGRDLRLRDGDGLEEVEELHKREDSRVSYQDLSS